MPAPWPGIADTALRPLPAASHAKAEGAPGFMTLHCLVTFWGTLVFADEVSGALRHGPIATAPRNVFLELAHSSATLRVTASCGPLRVRIDRNCLYAACPRQEDAALFLEILQEERTLISGPSGFLTAGPDGGMAADRPAAGEREQFVMLDEDHLDFLRDLPSTRWTRAGGNAAAPFRTQPEAVAEGFEVRLGDLRAGLTNGLSRFFIHDSGRSDAGFVVQSFSFFHGAMQVRHLARYEPLLYLCAFGGPDMFECLRLCVGAAASLAGFDGQIMVISDRTEEEVRELFPEALRSRIIHVQKAYDSKIGYTFARYDILEEVSCRYQPVCYIDTDVIVDKDVSGLLQQAAVRKRFFIGHEALPQYQALDIFSYPDGVGDWFGKWLLADEASLKDIPHITYSSGVFLFRNIADVRSLFKMMMRYGEGYARHDGRISELYDQPFLNYLLHTDPAVTVETLDRHLAFHGMASFEHALPKGFLHFQGGVGSAREKLAPMRKYVARLSGGASGGAGA
jgi:hypothetical protein